MAGNKRFLIQTNFSSSTNQIISTIADGDQIIIKKEVDSEKGASEKELKETMDSIHRDMVSEMELLFYISDKVKTINHPISNNKLGLVFLKKKLEKKEFHIRD